MIIKEVFAFDGRNIYSHKPVVKIILDIKANENITSKNNLKFIKKLITFLPGLKKHKCSLGIEGGFVKRLKDGTYPPHIIEHVAIELQNILGYDVAYGIARQINAELYLIVYEYVNKKAAIAAGYLACKLVNSLLNSLSINFKQELNQLKIIDNESSIGPSTSEILRAAREKSIPVIKIDDSLYQLGYGKFQQRIEASVTSKTGCIAVDISCSKSLTKKILNENDLPVPFGFLCEDIDTAISNAQKIGFPIVVKPESSCQGKGVTTNVKTIDELKTAFNCAKKFDNHVLVEEHIEGYDYRILVVGGSVVAASKRVPPYIIGNGVNSIEELIRIRNKEPQRGIGHSNVMTKIIIDNHLRKHLKKQCYSINSIIENGKKIYLRSNANLSTGGEAEDCTELVHQDNVDIAIRATKAIGLDIAGVDICCKDISKSILQTKGCILEVNAAPGLRMHTSPSKGKGRKVGDRIIEYLFPNNYRKGTNVISVTGTNGKTTTVRLISHILSNSGKNIGMTTTGGIFINGKKIIKGDTTGPKSARLVLTNPDIDCAVLETARGGIIREGLAYDLADIGIITNITEDHLGLANINSLEDMLKVKSLVVEAVKKDGYAILNADDKMCVQAAKRATCNLVYFSKQNNNLVLLEHIKNGGRAVYLEKNHIYISYNNKRIRSIDIKKIPLTLSGYLNFNVDNILVAFAAAFFLNVDVSTIENALKTFYPDQNCNPGRFNIFNVKDYRVIVDYAHNIDSYYSVCNALTKIRTGKLTGVIGVPGDRRDKDIIEVGKIAGSVFDKIIIKEDTDLRGRKSKETASLLHKGILSTGQLISHREIKYFRYETQALEHALNNAEPGEIIIVFYEDIKPIMKLINKAKNASLVLPDYKITDQENSV